MGVCSKYLPVTGQMLVDTYTCQRLVVDDKIFCCSIKTGGRIHACGMSIFFPILIPFLPVLECKSILSDSTITWINCPYRTLDCACVLLTPVNLSVRTVQACCGIIYPPCLFKQSETRVVPLANTQAEDKQKQTGDLTQIPEAPVQIQAAVNNMLR